MPLKKNNEKTTTTIRMNSDLRVMLESIAARESRSLSGQMIHFLSVACEQYLSENGFSFFPDVQEVGTEEEYRDYLTVLQDAQPKPDCD